MTSQAKIVCAFQIHICCLLMYVVVKSMDPNISYTEKVHRDCSLYFKHYVLHAI